MAKKVIQVPMDEALLRDLNAISKKQKKSRSEFIREACAGYVAKSREAELDKQYVEGYRKFPETTETARAQEKMLIDILPDEDW